ncbi:hypothetical protein BCT78_03295 [Vibrio breoganii]|nr:hypothetical protein BCT78_03295 [Vibrio breoganii]
MADMKYTTVDGYKEWTQRAIPEYGDVLFTREAPAGESCLVPENKKVCMGQRMVMLRPKEGVTDPVFLSLILNTERTKADISRLSIGSTVSRINIADIKKLKVSSPPLPEQRKIGKILSTWDKAIATTEKLIDTSKQQKKALMQQLLTGKKRLVNPETGEAFEGEWEEVRLGDIVDRSICYGVLKPGEHTENGIPLLRIQDLKTNELKLDKMMRITDELHHEFKRTILREGDLVISIVGTLGKVLMVPKELDGANITRAFAVIGVSRHDSLFVKQYLSSDYIQEWLLNTATGNAQKVLNIAAIKKLNLCMPSLFEQQKIASALNAADKEIEVLEAKLAHFKQEKKALMQQLLTGKRRVKVDDAETVQS